MKSKPKTEPEDLKLKIGSPEEVFWTNLRDKLTDDNINHKRQIIINSHMIAFAETRILQEKGKL